MGQLMENLGGFRARQFERKGIFKTGAGILSRGLKKVEFDNFGTISGDGKVDILPHATSCRQALQPSGYSFMSTSDQSMYCIQKSKRAVVPLLS